MRPDLNAYFWIVRWLQLSTDGFLVSKDEANERSEPELATEVTALLRARRDLNAEDKEILESIVHSSRQNVRRIRGLS
jgi:hypothetical protein